MQFLNFFKDRWNVVLGISLAIIVVITKFIVPPDISKLLAEGQVDYESFSKFIVAGIILLLLVPFSIYNNKKHKWLWWSIAVVVFITSIFLFFIYNDTLNRNTAYNKFSGERKVIGDHLNPLYQTTIDSLIRTGTIKEVSSSMLVERFGEPDQLWPFGEIRANAKQIIVYYIITMTAFSLFLLFSIQAVYCTSSKERKQTNAKISQG